MAAKKVNSTYSRNMQKLKKRKKRARIIIRNLSFKTTKQDLDKHFSQYGKIEESKILTKPDGKNVGCGFVQFEFVQSAAKAIHYGNLNLLLDRHIIVDWAVPKHKFCKNIKEENNGNNLEIKEDKTLDIVDNNDSLTLECRKISLNNEENEEDNDEKMEIEEMTQENVKENDVIEEKEIKENIVKHPRCISNDINEGKTIFLKNVPFSINNKDLKKYMEQFGPVYYALICIDPLTEYSKGTAFVKFKNVQDVEKCLEAGTKLRLQDQILEAHKALHKNEIVDKGSLNPQKKRDSRNLYLVKEGVVLAGSPAAIGVSPTDMTKRLQLEKWKSQMLRNLNMFVSRVRLVIHNLPPTLDNTKLRELFKKHSNSEAIIKEARVMRDMKNVDTTGIGKSKEYGFVSFTKHEDALIALRNINNNPNVFTKHKRPIVAFSIENRIMVNAKERRIQKSRKYNPLCTDNGINKKHENLNKNVSVKHTATLKLNDSDVKRFAGVTSKPGEIMVRSKFNLKSQAILHNQTIKKEKKVIKAIKRVRTERREKAKDVKIKTGSKFCTDDTNFNKLVNSYKDRLTVLRYEKSKWYENC